MVDCFEGSYGGGAEGDYGDGIRCGCMRRAGLFWIEI